ncbi:PepSY-like domain-containing protein [Salinimicrobium sp. TH3]|uniref:PepSY-like domain-containing protein n=1 Tax=Salinimicrobium sp. TH3 TaxID=2997342 RepID=UPI0022727BCC|nr:PepSY-like domain-containing protein [Salinimicrobium sp. TH3]MCY2687995.1 PepSY-like domain-containing protein [Salinimicrobium sp. TH3]
MKKEIVSAFFALFSIGMFAQTSTGNLPGTAQNFIKQHFSSVSVTGVEENSNWKIWEDEKYEVKLANGIELDFDENGNIIEIDSQNNEALPMTALPAKVASYLQANHADAEVIGWEKQDKEQEVELASGIEVEFDAQGNFRKLD